MNKKTNDAVPATRERRTEAGSGAAAETHDRPDRAELDQMIDEASLRDPDGFIRQPLRGDETLGDPDARDIAGGPDSTDTPRGREETKNDKAGAANQNG